MLLAAFVGACSAADGASRTPSRDAGAGFPPGSDAATGFQDAAMPTEPQPYPLPLDGELPAAREPSMDPGTSVETCFDGLDNDSTGAIDCDDRSCQSLRSCCVGNGLCGARVDSGTVALDRDLLGRCEGTTLSECLPDATTFGSPAPFLRPEGDGVAMAPGGDGQYASGVVLRTDGIDLRVHRSSLAATLARGNRPCVGRSCLDGLSFGFAAQNPSGTEAHVDAIAALHASDARGEVALEILGETVARWALEDEPESSWTLEFVPAPGGGAFWVHHGGAIAGPYPFAPTRPAIPVLWGHSPNPSAFGHGLAFLSAEVDVLLADMPDAWRDQGTLTMRVGGMPSPNAPGQSPTIAATDEGVVHIAWQGTEGIFFGRRDPSFDAGEFAARREPIVAGEGFRNPELVWNEEQARFWLWVDEATPDGSQLRLFVEAERGGAFRAGPSQSFPTSRPARNVSVVALPTSVRSRDSGATPRWAMVAQGPDERWRSFTSSDGAQWRPWPVIETALGGELQGSAYADPSLSVNNGAYHLYISERQGARWQTVLLASEDLFHWRLVERSILGPSESGFDRLGLRGVDVLDTPMHQEVVYAGDNGMRSTLLRAQRTRASSGLSFVR